MQQGLYAAALTYERLLHRAIKHGWLILNVYGWGATLALRGEISAARVITISINGVIALVD